MMVNEIGQNRFNGFCGLVEFDETVETVRRPALTITPLKKGVNEMTTNHSNLISTLRGNSRLST